MDPVSLAIQLLILEHALRILNVLLLTSTVPAISAQLNDPLDFPALLINNASRTIVKHKIVRRPALWICQINNAPLMTTI